MNIERRVRGAAFTNGLLSLVLLCLFAGGVWADRVYTRSETEIEGAEVDAWSPQNAPDMFMIRLLEEGSFSPSVYPVESSQIQRIEFDGGDGIPGRVGRMTFVNGSVRERCRVISFSGAEKAFTVVVPGGGAREQLSADSIAHIDFVRTTMKPGSVRSLAIDTPEAPTPTPAASVPNPNRTPVSGNGLPDLDYDDDGEFDAPLGTEVMGLGPAMGFDRIDMGEPDEFDEDDMEFDGGGWVTIPGLGKAVGFLALLVYLVVASVVGGCYLFWASRIEKVDDFPIWKSMITAGALSFFPVLFFLLCLRYIPVFGLWAGICAWYFSSRAIIMGSMEILEEKAGSVLHTYLAIQAGVFLLSVYIL